MDSYVNYIPSYKSAILPPIMNANGEYTLEKKGEIYMPLTNCFRWDMTLFDAPLVPLGQIMVSRDEFVEKWTLPFRRLKPATSKEVGTKNGIINMMDPSDSKTITFDKCQGEFDSLAPLLYRSFKVQDKEILIAAPLSGPGTTDVEMQKAEEEQLKMEEMDDDIDTDAVDDYINGDYKNMVKRNKDTKPPVEEPNDYYMDIVSTLREIRQRTDSEGIKQMIIDAYAAVVIDAFLVKVEGRLSAVQETQLRGLLVPDISVWSESDDDGFYVKVHEKLITMAPLSGVFNRISTPSNRRSRRQTQTPWQNT